MTNLEAFANFMCENNLKIEKQWIKAVKAVRECQVKKKN